MESLDTILLDEVFFDAPPTVTYDGYTSPRTAQSDSGGGIRFFDTMDSGAAQNFSTLGTIDESPQPEDIDSGKPVKVEVEEPDERVATDEGERERVWLK